MNRRHFLAMGLAAAGPIALWQFGLAAARHKYQLAPEAILPERLRGAAPEIREAYRFAVANRDILRYIPCYCGCGDSAGHTSNASCYVKDNSPVDKPRFDFMSVD